MRRLGPGERLEAVAALADPTRRAVYDLVRTADRPLTRDAVAEALALPRSTAAFHLDRLAALRLVSTSFVRTTGRTGPGAGRPAKHYGPLRREVSAGVPQREYDLAAELMARAIEESTRTGEPVAGALERAAAEEGRAAGAGAAEEGPDGLVGLLADRGYVPRPAADGGVDLLECPFHRLSDRHRELVCGMNRAYLRSAEQACGAPWDAEPVPPGGHGCCVRLVPHTSGAPRPGRSPMAESPTSE